MTQGCFTPEIIDRLLDQLSTDDGFRERLLGNPALVLHTMGVSVDPAQVPLVRKLPSKESIAQNRDAIKAKMDGKMGLIILLVE